MIFDYENFKSRNLRYIYQAILANCLSGHKFHHIITDHKNACKDTLICNPNLLNLTVFDKQEYFL